MVVGGVLSTCRPELLLRSPCLIRCVIVILLILIHRINHIHRLHFLAIFKLKICIAICASVLKCLKFHLHEFFRLLIYDLHMIVLLVRLRGHAQVDDLVRSFTPIPFPGWRLEIDSVEASVAPWH